MVVAFFLLLVPIMKNTVLIVLVVSLILTGCNIFNWTNGRDESHLDRGRELMSQGRYAEAEAEFASAMAEDPTNADARYHHAKAVIHDASFDILDLVGEITQVKDNGNKDGSGLPLYAFDIHLADEIYRVNLIIVEDLRPIYDGVTHGSITSSDIDVDLAIAYLITGILGLRDTNRDSTINDDDIILDINYSLALESYSIVGLHQFLGEGITNRSHQIDTPCISPNDINSLIDYVLHLIEESDEIIIAVIHELDEDISDNAIKAFLDDVRTTITKYYYDNDEDDDGNNGADEETLNGHDDDGDGYIDEDTDHV